MTGILVTAGVALGLLIACGLAVLAFVPERLRGSLVPAVPALGAAGLVLVLHVTSLVVPTREVAPFVVAALAVSVPVSVYRLVRPVPLPKASVRLAVSALVVGLALGGFALLPSLRLGRQTVVDAGIGNDSAAFVGLTDWLEGHVITATPRFKVDAPAYGYTHQHQNLQARIGQDLVQGLIAGTVHLDADQTWYTVTCLWLVLVPGAFAAAGLALFRSRLAALVAGVAAAGTSVVLTQAFNQNSASLLGVGLVPLAVTGIVSRVERPATQLSSRRWPLWLAGGALAALIGAYSEYLSILGPAVLLIAVARPLRAWLPVGRELGRLALATVALGPVEWFRGVRSLTHNLDGSFFPRVVTPFTGVTPGRFVNRITGATSHVAASASYLQGGSVRLAAVAVVATAGLGVVLAATVARPWRRVWLALVVSSIVAVTYLIEVRHFAYGAQRAIEIAVPLAVLAIAAGLERTPGLVQGWVERLAAALRMSPAESARAVRGAPFLAGGVVAALVVVSLTVNLQTASEVASRQPGPERVVTADFPTAARWLSAVGGDGGNAAMVIDSNEFSETWMAYSARRLLHLAYPFMRSNESDGPPFGLWDGTLRRWAVVGPEELVVPPGAGVGGVGQFTYIDFARPDTLVASPVAGSYAVEVDRTGRFHWFSDNGQLQLIGTCRSGQAYLRLATVPALDGLPVDIEGAAQVFHAVVAASGTDVVVPMPAHRGLLLTLHNERPAAVTEDDPRALAVQLRSIGCVPLPPPAVPRHFPNRPSRTRRSAP